MAEHQRQAGSLLLAACLLVPFTLLAAQTDAIVPSLHLLPPGQTLAGVTKNPYFAVGLTAASEGLSTLTITVAANPANTLPERINEAHLGLMASGWHMLTQGTVEIGGSTTWVLLTYRR